MHSPIDSRTPGRSYLVSRTSILIFGGVLIGSTLSETFEDGFGGVKFYAFVAAMIGLLSFLGLDSLANRKRLSAQQRAEQEAAEKMDQRVTRHISD